MNLFNKMTLRTKLSIIIMSTVAVSLIISSGFFLVYEHIGHIKALERNVSMLAELIGDSAIHDLINHRTVKSDEAMKAMSMQPNILAIYILDNNGDELAEYKRFDNLDYLALPRPVSGEQKMYDDYLLYNQNLEYKGEILGSTLIAISTKFLDEQSKHEAITAGLITIAALLFAFAVTYLIQKLISRPILNLAETIKHISEDKNYSARLEATTNDEIGFLITHFNEMLQRLQDRDRAIALTRQDLEKRVKERTSALEKEITERREIERNRIQRLSRVRRHQKAISELFNNAIMMESDLSESMNKILELTGKAIDTAITGIWLFNNDNTKLVCHGSYNLYKHEFTSGFSLSVEDYPNYFNALKGNRVIDASDAVNDPRTSDFTTNYLLPLGISSMLDAPINISGQPVGVVCFEHIGKKRKWTIDEITFAGVVTDQISQLILNKERKNNEEARSILLEIFEASIKSTRLNSLLKTVHKLINRVFDAPNMYVALYDPRTNRYSFPYCVDAYDSAEDLTPQEMDNSLTDYVRRTDKPLLINKAGHQKMMDEGKVQMIGTTICTWLGVPLKTADGAIGVMTIQNYEDENAYSKSDLDLMATISNYVAMTIERMKSEEMIRENEAKYRTLFDTANDAIFLMQADRFIDCNSKTLEMFKCERDQIINQPPYKFSPPEQPDGRGSAEKALEKINGAIEGRPQFFEWVHCRYDGKPFYAEVSLNKMILKNEIFLLAVVRDIDERKTSEEHQRNLQEKLERAERMESLGVLAGGVAHDLNNMLGPMVGYPELILRKVDQESPIRGQIQRIGNAAREAAEVIQDLLTLARRGRYEMEVIDINNVVNSYLDSPNFRKLDETHENVRVQINLDESIGRIKGSAPHLSKVIMNLVVNAFDAAANNGKADDKGLIQIKTEQRYINQLDGGHDKIESGDYIILRIKDNGGGIAPDDLDKIFEPYYSKKKMGASGSGLGLSVVYGIIKDHKAYYDIFSKIGRGAEFIFYFPLCLEKVNMIQLDEIDLEGTEKILIVDDIVEQREIATALLESLGYTTECCESGREAVEYFKNNEAELIVMDMIMEPDFDGLDAYREILKIKPDQKAIIVSGFSATERVNEMIKLGAGQYIRKPYTLESLARAVRAELDRAKVLASA